MNGHEAVEGQGIGWVEIDEDAVVKFTVSDGDEEFSVAASMGPGTFALIKTPEGNGFTPEAEQ